jgi:hypothetical protein
MVGLNEVQLDISGGGDDDGGVNCGFLLAACGGATYGREIEALSGERFKSFI